MIDKDQVLAVVKENGPLIPRDVVKILGTDTFFVGAMLSTLVDSKTIRITSTKIGSTPFYYFPGQEPKLEQLYQYLNEKDKKAYDILKDRKIIKDSEADPLLRVALRNIKDFARPLEVQIGDKKEIFWKWYLFPTEEAEKLIRGLLTPVTTEKKAPEIPTQSHPQEPEKIKEGLPKAEKIPEIVQELKKNPEPLIQKEQKIEKIMKAEMPQKERQEKIIVPEPAIQKRIEDELLGRVMKRFDDGKIRIIETNILRKNSDIEMIVYVSSPVGNLKYFCKIRDKKKNNDKDISSVFVQAQMKKLPALYITTGEVTKKAADMLESDFTTITVVRI